MRVMSQEESNTKISQAAAEGNTKQSTLLKPSLSKAEKWKVHLHELSV